MSDRTFIRFGAGLLMLGGVISILGIILHDRTLPTASGEERILHIAEDAIWTWLHFLVAIGTIVSLGGFVALYRFLSRSGTSAFAQLATVSAVVGACFSLVTLSVDGFAIRLVAEDWVNAPEATKQTLFAIAHAFEHLNLTLFSMFILQYFGVTFLLYGVALVRSDDLPKPLGWVAIAIGVGGVLAGSYQLLVGLTIPSTTTFVISWGVAATWQLLVGILMFRNAKMAEGPVARTVQAV